MVYYSGYWQTQKHSTAHCTCISACSMTSFPWTESVKYWCLDVGIYYVATSFLSWLCFDIHVVCFLICFPMKYWDFSVKSKPILPLLVTSEITIFIFTVSKNGLFMNSWLKVLPEGLKCSILVRNYGEDINVPRTSDVTYCADVTLFLHATSGRLSLTAAFCLRRCLAFYCFKCYLASFSRYKTVFLPNIMPPKHAKQYQIDAKWLGKNSFLTWESKSG